MERNTLTGRELLELAAKAAGIDYWVVKFAPRSAPIEKLHMTVDGETVEWNPLTDDGDALRLAVKLGLDVEMHGCISTHPYAGAHDPAHNITEEEQPENGDPYAATRRAIVRAAAEIGRAM